MSDKQDQVPPVKMYSLFDEYPGIDLEKTRARFEVLSGFFTEMLDEYVSGVLDKYGNKNDYMDKDDYMKEILLHDPFIHDILTRSLVYPPFKPAMNGNDSDILQLELDL